MIVTRTVYATCSMTGQKIRFRVRDWKIVGPRKGTIVFSNITCR